MRTQKRQPRRPEIKEKIHQHKSDMESREVNLDRIASDVETVRETLEELEFDGTVEGTEEIETEIENAEDVTVEIFEEEDDTLDLIQEDASEYEDEMSDRSDSSENDLKKVSMARAKIETKETVAELQKAKEAVVRDIEFLIEQIGIANEDIKNSEQAQRDLNKRVHDDKKRRRTK